MAHTVIGDLLHAPVEILLAAIQERQPRMNSILNSPLVMTDSRWANRALSDGGTSIEIPVLSPLPGGYTLQNPGTPATVDNLSSVKQRAAVMYREKAWGRDAFAVAQSGLDPLNWIADQINTVRRDGVESALVATLKGIFLSSDFSSLRITTPNEDAGSAPEDNVPWDSDVFFDTIGILGIKVDDLRGGVIAMHSKLRTYLTKLDEIDYVKPSTGDLLIPFYKGLRIVADDRLVRAGTSSGFVYPFYVCGPQTIVYSLATQGSDGTLSSSLAFDADIPNLRKALYDRIVTLIHVNGTIWTPTGPDPDLTVANGGPTDAQLATADAWGTTFENVKEHRIVSGEVNI